MKEFFNVQKASFCLFSYFLHEKYSKKFTINDENIDGVLRSQTRGGRIVAQSNPPSYGGTP